MDTHRKNSTEGQKEHNSYQEISKADQEIYDFLDRSFEKENTDGFSFGFSKIITRKIEAKQQRRFNIKIWVLVSVLVLSSIPIFISFLNTEVISMLFSVFLQNIFIVAFLLFGVFLVQFGDRFTLFKKNI